MRNDAVADDLNGNPPNPFLVPNFAIAEETSLLVCQEPTARSNQLRAERLTRQDHSQFPAPDTKPFSTNSGKVPVQTAAVIRFFQMQLKVRS